MKRWGGFARHLEKDGAATARWLIDFEDRVAAAFEAGKIMSPVHLSGGNEDALIRIFQNVREGDWCFSTHRSHYHALLHGVPEEDVFRAILAGHSMALMFPEHRFFASSIIGGTPSVALGVAAAELRLGSSARVWCFLGDMAAMGGAAFEARLYAERNDLPLEIVIEDNGYSTNTKTQDAWGRNFRKPHSQFRYAYQRTRPHVGTGRDFRF